METREELERDVREWLDVAEPDLMVGLDELWRRMGGLLTGIVLWELAQTGVLSAGVIGTWIAMVGAWIDEEMDRVWRRTALHAGRGIAGGEALKRGIGEEWRVVRGRELRRRILRSVDDVVRVAQGGEGGGGMGQILRGSIGMTERQAQALRRRRRSWSGEEGVSPAALQRRVDSYARQLRDVRGRRIARTETMAAYNSARLEQVVFMSGGEVMERMWVTVEDRRLCKPCGALDGAIVEIGDPWPGGGIDPPLHPGCRCVIMYL